VSASDLSRWFGGAVTYWTRRITGQQSFSAGDLESVALACEIHPAELFGGVAPLGWESAPFDRTRGVTREYDARRLAQWPMLLRAELGLQRSA
jgi:hypothetical protein